eukprot:TRINITY_DN43851_c0_g1_i1.p1 TRINITY_DN43851_c0_g1~~TRINITY_DN43851_c0_g1_i1.p1  ORF type:complete len:319 (+),score=112.05 TRINITY_DN43851_c0_g1_i1:50-958(+)
MALFRRPAALAARAVRGRCVSAAARGSVEDGVGAACAAARKDRAQEDATLLELVQAAAADGNNAIPSDARTFSKSAVTSQGLQGLEGKELSARRFLVPDVWVHGDRKSRSGLPLYPPNFSKDVCQDAKKEFGLTFEAGGAFCNAFVDPSYNPSYHNGSLVLVGNSLLHLYVRSWVVQALPDRDDEEHRALATRLLSLQVLAHAARGWDCCRYVLTDMAMAKRMGRRSFFGGVVPPSLLRHYAIPGGSEEVDGDVVLQCYADLLVAVVGAVYIEHGIDHAAQFIQNHCVRKMSAAACVQAAGR